MNPNDIMAQQQAYMNQLMQNAHQTQWALIAVWIASMLVSFIVIYLFYARLRDIVEEVKKLRIAFEMSEDRKALTATSPRQAATPSDEDRFMPKTH
jgi:phosphate/sulfate permease